MDRNTGHDTFVPCQGILSTGMSIQNSFQCNSGVSLSKSVFSMMETFKPGGENHPSQTICLLPCPV